MHRHVNQACDFCSFFMTSTQDQVTFMSNIFQNKSDSHVNCKATGSDFYVNYLFK
jgi:hypothetical protein